MIASVIFEIVIIIFLAMHFRWFPDCCTLNILLTVMSLATVNIQIPRNVPFGAIKMYALK
jgi:hypothetical protein